MTIPIFEFADKRTKTERSLLCPLLFLEPRSELEAGVSILRRDDVIEDVDLHGCWGFS